MVRAVAIGSAVLVALFATLAHGEPVRMRYPEGPAHGFIALSDEGGTQLAQGELIQGLERGRVASQLVIRFYDGSLYDEVVRFTQRPVFRLVSYRLVQRGPAFTESEEVSFDRSGRYEVRRQASRDEPEEHVTGQTDVPEDVSNGLTSILLKNLMPDGSATTHLLVFRPKPRVLALKLTPEGTDRYTVGSAPATATRFLIQPEVEGALGVLATLAGKQPPSFRMWLARGQAPVLVRFEGPLYADGPTWRVELSAPRWEP